MAINIQEQRPWHHSEPCAETKPSNSPSRQPPYMGHLNSPIAIRNHQQSMVKASALCVSRIIGSARGRSAEKRYSAKGGSEDDSRLQQTRSRICSSSFTWAFTKTSINSPMSYDNAYASAFALLTPLQFLLTRGICWFPLRDWLTQAYATQRFAYASLLWHNSFNSHEDPSRSAGVRAASGFIQLL